jgi:hypothetical protein
MAQYNPRFAISVLIDFTLSVIIQFELFPLLWPVPHCSFFKEELTSFFAADRILLSINGYHSIFGNISSFLAPYHTNAALKETWDGPLYRTQHSFRQFLCWFPFLLCFLNSNEIKNKDHNLFPIHKARVLKEKARMTLTIINSVMKNKIQERL